MVSSPLSSYSQASLANMVDRSVGTFYGSVVWNNDQHVGFNEATLYYMGDSKITQLNVLTALSDTARFAELNGLENDSYLFDRLTQMSQEMTVPNALYDVTKF